MGKVNWIYIKNLKENEYGGLYVTCHNGRHYWVIDNWNINIDNIDAWQEIPKSLYDEILKHLNSTHYQQL